MLLKSLAHHCGFNSGLTTGTLISDKFIAFGHKTIPQKRFEKKSVAFFFFFFLYLTAFHYRKEKEIIYTHSIKVTIIRDTQGLLVPFVPCAPWMQC